MSEQKVIRPEEHETDTAARRIAPLMMPTYWEHREPGGRDYGIDMQAEVFQKGRATGGTLLLQIKGTTKPIDESASTIPYDLKVTTLKYSELFAVPFLLVLCPVNSQPHCWYYLWLQEYIDVVLNYDNPDWRDNEATVRVHVPIGNKMPGRHLALEQIAGEPRRIKSWGRLAHLNHEIQWAMADLEVKLDQDEDCSGNFKIALDFVEELKRLPGLDMDSAVGSYIQLYAVQPLEGVLKLLVSGEKISLDDLRKALPQTRFDTDAINRYLLGDGECAVDQQDAESNREWVIKTMTVHQLEAAIHSLKASLSQYFDTRLRNTLWRLDGLHRF